MLGTSLDVRTNSSVTFFNGLLHMDIRVLADQQKYIHSFCADTGYHQEDLSRVMANRNVWRGKEGGWEKETEGEPKVFVLSTLFYDDDDDLWSYFYFLFDLRIMPHNPIRKWRRIKRKKNHISHVYCCLKRKKEKKKKRKDPKYINWANYSL